MDAMIIPTFRQLSFLTALADTGSFSRAAEVCNVTQPTLSAGIKELELTLGVTLAERQARGARLTHAGEQAAASARKLLADAHDLVRTAQHGGKLFTGPFTLGAIPTIAPFVLPGAARQLNETYPDLKLYLTEDKTDRLLDQLHARTIDAALIALPWPANGIDVLPLLDDEFLFAAPKTHPLAGKNGIAPEDLADEDILLLEDGHCLRDHALSICKLQTGEHAKQVAATSLGTLVNMVAGGLGVSLLPRLATEHGLQVSDDVAVRAFTEPVIGRQIGIAWRSGSSRETEARAIGALVKDLLS